MNVLLKADRALSKLSFLLHLELKINLVTSRKYTSHLHCYEIDLSFSIKLQEINLHYRSELWDHLFFGDCLNYLNFNSVSYIKIILSIN